MPKRTTRANIGASRIATLCVATLQLFFAADVARSQQRDTDNVIRFFQWKVTQDPDDFFNYDRLGVAYIQKARETGDVTYYNLAAQTLEKSRDLESGSAQAAPAMKHLASVYYAEHRFGETLALAQKAVELNPRDVTSYAVIGDARSEMGEYDAAWADYAKLQAAPDAQAADSGVEYLRESRAATKSILTGDAHAAIEQMQRAVNISLAARMPKESIAWSQFALGENYFQLGEFANAKTAYNDAL